MQCGAKRLDLSHAVVMGVLNVTPDSFSDGGRYLNADAACELARVIPVIERLAGSAAVISIDTGKPEVMRAAAAAGAGLINDVRALRAPGALQALLESDCAVCLMHMQGEPATMQQAPRYLDVVNEIKAFLFERAQGCLAAGIARQRIVIDPGFGFGKTPAHNLELLRRLEEFTQGDWPVLVGLSRKSTLASIVGRGQEADRLPASIACAVVAVFKGARIIRAHDVAATVDALKVVAALEAERAE